MSWFNIMRRHVKRRTDKEGETIPPPFPTVSTFLGIAAVMIVIWLLVYGPPHLPSASDRSVPANISDTGANK
ncbi:hypothetical protein [Mesorhizobium sp. NZP2077]|uniref:hypothetical protein n=1 Tax=Mesorhizobium sp. NZP2077 TaxID=2483404 RepID=UPI0015550263|nr:hypothetical protein [Mesorhizobium sp. NZP2077]QKC81833.1 hypothetical protein EB232_09485 [Mesorhizobium sp. NZP2077]QKD15297.1 hypothetical protein HGP13_09340 [Mesorhizobium sp. NZP2077]